MMANIFIIVGAIIVVFSLIVFARILFLPITKAFGVVFERKDDYIKYESEDGRQLLESETRLITIGCVVFLFIGIGLIVLGFAIKNANHGNASLFSNNVPGVENYASGITPKGTYISEDGIEYNHYIIVYENSVIVDNETFEVDDYISTMDNLDRNITIYVIDDYASSKAFKAICKALDEHGIKKVTLYD